MKRKLIICTVFFFVLLFPWALAAQTTVSDVDGNVYRTVKIGTQVWMAENLKTTKYRNGDPIANIAANGSWSIRTSGAYCWYENDLATKPIYGGLYNWFAVADSRSIAPIGWHVPSDAEWRILIDFLGGEVVAGGKLKESGTAHWSGPNNGATNSNDFTALPGGLRSYGDGTFHYVGNNGYWWSSTAYDAYEAWYRDFGYRNAVAISNGDYKQNGFSVRCIKD